MKEILYEIRVMKTDSIYLSSHRVKIMKQLEQKGKDFDYQGYAKMSSYKIEGGATRVEVEPLNGTVLDLQKEIMDKIKKEREQSEIIYDQKELQKAHKKLMRPMKKKDEIIAIDYVFVDNLDKKVREAYNIPGKGYFFKLIFKPSGIEAVPVKSPARDVLDSLSGIKVDFSHLKHGDLEDLTDEKMNECRKAHGLPEKKIISLREIDTDYLYKVLKTPLRIEVTPHKDGEFIFYEPTLRLLGTADTNKEGLFEIQEQFVSLWKEYVDTKDELAPDAIKLRDKLKKM